MSQVPLSESPTFNQLEARVDTLEGLQQGAAISLKEDWTELSSITGSAGDAALILTDGGNHTDPVTSGSVANSGLYLWRESPAGWEWIAPTEAYTAQAWAEGTEPGGVGTKSAKEWAEGVELVSKELNYLKYDFNFDLLKSQRISRDYGKPTAVITADFGQSGTVARSGGVALRIPDSDSIFMFSGGKEVQDMAFTSSNAEHSVHASDLSGLQTFDEGTSNQGLGSGKGTKVLTSKVKEAMFYSIGIGSRNWDTLIGGYPRSNMFATAEKSVALMRGRGLAVKPKGVTHHGEAAMHRGDTYQEYYDDFRNAMNDFQLAQALALDNPDYVAPIAVGLPLNRAYTNSPEIIQAAVDATRDHPEAFLADVAYDKLHEGDRTHKRWDSYALFGENVQNRHNLKDQGVDVSSPFLIEAQREGDTIYFRFHVRAGYDLERDPDFTVGDLMSVGTSVEGFEVFRNGSLIDLSGATLELNGSDGGKIVLTSDLGAVVADEKLRYGLQATTSSLVGPDFAKYPGGPLKSTVPGMGSEVVEGFTHYDWASPGYAKIVERI